MKVITLLNEKGGVGKTSLSTHVAAGLAIRGAKVLLIDADAQANATSALRLPEADGMYRLLVKPNVKWRDVLVAPAAANWSGDYRPDGKLMVLPSNIETRVIPMVMDDMMRLRLRLQELRGYFDVAVIDTSPTPSLLHAMIYLASDLMVYPSQAELLSLIGIGKTLTHMKNVDVQRNNIGLESIRLAGVVPTMFRRNTVAHKHGLDELKNQFGDAVTSPVAERITWSEASYAQQMLYAYAPGSDAETDAWCVVDRVQEAIA